MPVETRAQAAKMEEQVKQLVVAQMGARMEKMDEQMEARNKEMDEKMDARNKEMKEEMGARWRKRTKNWTQETKQ